MFYVFYMIHLRTQIRFMSLIFLIFVNAKTDILLTTISTVQIVTGETSLSIQSGSSVWWPGALPL